MGINVIVVENDDTNRERYLTDLRSVGHNVIGVRTIAELDRLQRRDRVFMDDLRVIIFHDDSKDTSFGVQTLVRFQDSRREEGNDSVPTVYIGEGLDSVIDKIQGGVVLHCSGFPSDISEVVRKARHRRMSYRNIGEATKDSEGLCFDPLYPHVVFFRDRKGDLTGLVRKTRENPAVAKWEKEALAHYRHGVSAEVRGKYVYLPHIWGLEVHELLTELGTLLRDNQMPPNEKEFYKKFKHDLFSGLIDSLADVHVNPYIPYESPGKERVDNPKLRDYYKEKTHGGFTLLGRKHLNGNVDNVLRQCLEFYDVALPKDDDPHSAVRYQDNYTRNTLLGFEDNSLGENRVLKPTARDLYQIVTSKASQENLGIDEASQIFIDENLRMVDAHRVTKIAFDLESFFHIVDDPRAELTEEERENYYCRYLLKKEHMIEERKSSRNATKLRRIEELLERTEDSNLKVENVQDVIEESITNRLYYLTMRFYRAHRWFALVAGNYVPQYTSAIDKLSTIPASMRISGKKKRRMIIEEVREHLVENSPDEYARTRLKYREDKPEVIPHIKRHRTKDLIARMNVLNHNQVQLESYRHDMAFYDRLRREALDELIRNVYSEYYLTLNGSCQHLPVQFNDQDNSFKRRDNSEINPEDTLAYTAAIYDLRGTQSPGDKAVLMLMQLVYLKHLFGPANSK